jgi:hypothetical protein
MKHWLVLVAVALVIWWVFFRKKGVPALNERQRYLAEDNAMCSAHDAECNNFVDQYVTFEGGPEAFKKLHEHIRHQYDHAVAGLFHMKEEFSAKHMPEYISQLNEIPKLYVDEMSELYKKYTIPESLRNKHMNMINSQHLQRLQKEQRWYKIMEPFIKK